MIMMREVEPELRLSVLDKGEVGMEEVPIFTAQSLPSVLVDCYKRAASELIQGHP
jgi:hypothetical protein